VTFTSGADRAWITDEIGIERAGKAYLRASQIGAVGGLLGLAVAALLGSIRVNLPIQIGAVLILLLAVLMLLKMPETGFHPTPKAERNTFGHMRDTLRKGITLIRSRRVLGMVVAVGLIIGLYSEGYDRLNTQHILTNYVFPSIEGVQPIAWISLLRAVSMLLGIFVTEALQRRVNTENRHALNRALIWSCVPMVIGLLVFGLSESLIVMLAAYWTFNVMRGVVGALYGAWINHYFESSVRATMNSMMSQVDAVGQIAGGPLVGGFAQGMTGLVGLGTALRLTMLLCSLLLSPVVYFFGRAARHDALEIPETPNTAPDAV
jgi:DHA3 family tetracycline resistance protein-like MFS transporter